MKEHFDEQLDIFETFRAIAAGWRVIFTATALGFLAAVLYTNFYTESTYLASSRVIADRNEFCLLHDQETPSVAIPPFNNAFSGLENLFCPHTFDASLENLALTVANSDEIFSSLAPGAAEGMTIDPHFSSPPEIDVQVNGENIGISVSHNSSDLAVAMANRLAENIVLNINTLAAENLQEIHQELSQTLQELDRYDNFDDHRADGILSVVRLSTQRQLRRLEANANNERTVSRVASSASIEPKKFNQILITAPLLSALVATFIAIYRSSRSGAIHGIATIAREFERNGNLELSTINQAAVNDLSMWQELRVAAGNLSEGVIAIGGHLEGSLLKEVGIRLYEEFARTSSDVILIDTASVLTPKKVTETSDALTRMDLGSDVHAFSATNPEFAVQKLKKSGRMLLILAPRDDVDLPLMQRVFELADAKILLIKRGSVSKAVVRRMLLAETGSRGNRALCVVV